MIGSTVGALAVLSVVYLQGAPPSKPCGAISPTAPTSEVGAVSNVRYTEEHAYGETVWLWRTGNCIFGLFASDQGLQGDTPLGELKNVTYSTSTGKMRFDVDMTRGLIAGRASSTPQPSRDRFTFDGTLGATRLVGNLTHATQLNPTASVRDIVLQASARAAARTSSRSQA